MLLITENYYTFISAGLLLFRALTNVGGSTPSSHVLDCVGTRCSIGQVIQYLDKKIYILSQLFSSKSLLCEDSKALYLRLI